MKLLRYVQAVLWSFIGLGRRSDMAELHRTGHPLVLVIVAVALAALLVGLLVGVAVVAVRTLG
ncbi:DUF2970 domain-containing protein [Aquincola sp. MAHUQ-54]|uniref:DUF2970 domain-containing protein n=1 Tax=Aquincola agrisoli TaxID=3119538 RepID=A0AAW9Q171_9BURK